MDVHTHKGKIILIGHSNIIVVKLKKTFTKEGIMKVRIPDYYEEFKCIADKCTDTCCAGWEVDVDDDSFLYYKTIKGEFGKRLKSVMIKGRGSSEGRFRIKADGRCPFLNQENFCDLYTELGEEHLCITCAQYPRYTTEFGGLKETGIALSCITAGELILRNKTSPTFYTYETEEQVGLHNIDGFLYVQLMKAREEAFKIVSDRQYTIWQRMKYLLLLTEELQQVMNDPCEMDGIIRDFHIRANWDINVEVNSKKNIEVYRSIFSYYKKLRIIKKEWPIIIEEIDQELYHKDYKEVGEQFHLYYKEKEYEYENIMAYFVFRYFMKAVFDKELLSKMKMGIVSTLVILQCDMSRWNQQKKLEFQDQVYLAHIYSREIEHSEENFAKLSKMFKKKSAFSVENILRLIEMEIKNQ